MPRPFDLEKCRASIQERMARIEGRLKKLNLNWSDLDKLPQNTLPQPLIYLGPSLPLEQAQNILEAQFRGPIARGDLIQALEAGYRIFGIVDGVFHQNLTVGIEEIRYALEAGATIYGASSMGALRAAETYPLGMIGIGQIYQWYRDETVDSDDEVALCFEAGSKISLSEPSVNLRATLNFLTQTRQLTTEQCGQILASYLSLHFSQRNLPTLEKTLTTNFPEAQKWIALLQKNWVDQKAKDAFELLTVIRDKHANKAT